MTPHFLRRRFQIARTTIAATSASAIQFSDTVVGSFLNGGYSPNGLGTRSWTAASPSRTADQPLPGWIGLLAALALALPFGAGAGLGVDDAQELGVRRAAERRELGLRNRLVGVPARVEHGQRGQGRVGIVAFHATESPASPRVTLSESRRENSDEGRAR